VSAPSEAHNVLVQIDWIHFTPWRSLAGGLLIGAAASALVLLNGRILGVSGIVGGLLPPQRGDAGWRASFLLGLASAPLAWALFAPAPAVRIDAGWLTLVAAGVLVGAGTRLGGGCTSGHGVCGISRLSPRSLLATVIFMSAGIATVAMLRHVMP
jgi:uncharacterized membrane protein YedE/YeeE